MSNDIQPEIRFPGFTEAWEQRKLIDLVVRLNKSTNSSRLPKVEFEDIVAGEGRLNKDVSQKFDNRKGIEFLPNDILYGKLRPYLKNWLKATFTGVAIGDFWVFRAKKSDSDFIYSLIQADRYQKAANDTSGTKMPRSDWKKVSGTVFYIPNDLKEQQKIGTFFKQLDDTIALQQRKLDLLKETKKGFLQKMFPKNGAKVPEIRFSGFTEDWEQRKLKYIFKYRQGQQVPVENQYFESGENRQKFIRIVDLTQKNEVPRYIEYFGENIIQKDDLFMIRYGQPGIVGYGYNGVIANNLFRLIPKISINNLFFYFILQGMFPMISKLSSSTTMPALSFNSLDLLEVKFPSSLIEQQKIGSFFKQLDDIITLHQRKLDLLKETKKGFLQKMFV